MDQNNIPQILLLDDDRDAAAGIQSAVEAIYPGPIGIWLANTVDEARTILREQDSILDVVITDIMMDDGTPGGLSIAAEAGGRLPVIVISAYDRADFGKRAADLGPVQFVEKTQGFEQNLVQQLQSAIAWKTWENAANPAETELRSLCLAREPGTVLAIRSHLSPVELELAGTSQATIVDLGATASGFRQIETAIERHGGYLYALHDQNCMAAFREQDRSDEAPYTARDGQKSLRDAFESCRTVRGLLRDFVPVLSSFPFSAALVPGVIVTGVFGSRTPGRASVLGRSGDIAMQLALRGQPGEICVALALLDSVTLDWWQSLNGERRTESQWIVGVDTAVDVEFLKPKVTQ